MATEPFRTRVVRRVGSDWERSIADLDREGVAVPLPSRPEWMRLLRGSRPAWLVTAHDSGDRCHAALALEVERSRALPWHFVARAHHLGSALAGEAGDAVLARAAALAHEERRLLRMNFELLLLTPEEHARIGRTLRSLGFSPAPRARNYHDTLVVGLEESEERILQGFSATTRRDLRHWSERPIAMRLITEVRYTDRLNSISRETFGRTGGEWTPRPWAERIALSSALPQRSRLVGLFREGVDAPDGLLAYAWGCAHGDYAHYDDAGSTRLDDIKVSMAYPLMWDLIRWAKREGCRWFDMGGVPPDDARPDDPRSSIAGFKRRFSKRQVRVGKEWVLEPRPGRARVAAALNGLARRLIGGAK